MTEGRQRDGRSDPRGGSATLRLRLDLVLLFALGFAVTATEVSIRTSYDLPLTEMLLIAWGLLELVGRRLRLELERKPALYLFGLACALLAAWIALADAANAQAVATTVRNVLKYLVLFLAVAWIAVSPSRERIAVLLLGSILGTAAVGFSVLVANPDTPYLAKYHTPYLGLLVLAAWAAGRPFAGVWRAITAASVLCVAFLAVAASARWSVISGIVVCLTALLPRPTRGLFRSAVVVASLAPLVPLLMLDTEAALGLIAAHDLHAAADVERVLLYAFAHESIFARPLFGIGFEGFLGQFESVFGHVLTMTSSVQGPHNQYAAIGTLFGLPALAFYALAVGAAVALLHSPNRRPSRLSLAAVGLWGLMFLANEISDDTRLGLYLLATLLAYGEPARNSALAALLPTKRPPQAIRAQAA